MRTVDRRRQNRHCPTRKHAPVRGGAGPPRTGHEGARGLRVQGVGAVRATTHARGGACTTATRCPAVSADSVDARRLSRTFAFGGIVSVTVLYVAFFVPSRIVSCSPLTDCTKPRSTVTVVKPVLVATTTFAWTARRSSTRALIRSPRGCVVFAAVDDDEAVPVVEVPLLAAPAVAIALPAAPIATQAADTVTSFRCLRPL